MNKIVTPNSSEKKYFYKDNIKKVLFDYMLEKKEFTAVTLKMLDDMAQVIVNEGNGKEIYE